ncbi:hypothetical protein ACKWTF_013258 [Chironomus riparius]
MNSHLFYIVILLLLSFKTAYLNARSKQSLLNTPRFKTFSCIFSQEMLEMIHPNVTCKIDKIDRRTSALNVYIGFKVPTDHIFSQCHLYYKSDGVFREVIVTPEFDWCLIGRATQEGFFLQQFSEMIRKVVPKLISDCPRSFLEIRNLTLPSHPFFNFLPSGVFKFIAKMRFVENGPNLYNVTGTFQFESVKDKLGN